MERLTRSVVTLSSPSVNDLLEISRWTSFPQFSESELVSWFSTQIKVDFSNRKRVAKQKGSDVERRHTSRAKVWTLGFRWASRLRIAEMAFRALEGGGHLKRKVSPSKGNLSVSRAKTYPVSPSSETLSQISRNFSQLTSVCVSAVAATEGGARARPKESPLVSSCHVSGARSNGEKKSRTYRQARRTGWVS